MPRDRRHVFRGVARADIRSAARRLIAACRDDVADVTVRRRDVELLLALAVSHLAERGATMPDLHPGQR